MTEILGNKADLIIPDELAKVYETYGTSRKAITNSNVGAIHTPDDIIFPDMLGGQSNEQIDEYINGLVAAGMIGALLPMPYHQGSVYDALGYDFDQVPSPNMIHRMDAHETWPERQYGGTQRVKPRVTKRQKTLKARALNKANRKRARHG